MEDCIFCKIVSGEIPAKKLYEDDKAIAFEDLNPKAPVHILIIPKKHLATSLEAKEEDKGLMGHLFLTANKLAQEKGIDRSGFRLVVNCNEDAGQSVFHLHFHLMGGRFMAWPPG
ncbi:MAG: histidine triad nucleotide-binding protein [Nitrospinota bacterium]|nr:histidine triad nucleotide-binding protein [Nitrospinota bacterium]